MFLQKNIISINIESKNVEIKEEIRGMFELLLYNLTVQFKLDAYLYKNVKQIITDEENKLILFKSFIEDITISDGIATYHIKLQYWDLFDISGFKKVLKYDKETILKLFYGINK